jgi:hypothetical protein
MAAEEMNGRVVTHETIGVVERLLGLVFNRCAFR